MRPPRSVKPLPRYVRRKSLAGYQWAYFFEPPTWARRAGCPVVAEPLGHDYDFAVRRAEDVLLKAFDSWRTGGLSDMVPIGPVPGTFNWLVSVFKAHQAWADIDRKTRRLYDQGLALFSDHILKDGTRVGSKNELPISPAVSLMRSMLSFLLSKKRKQTGQSLNASGGGLQMPR